MRSFVHCSNSLNKSSNQHGNECKQGIDTGENGRWNRRRMKRNSKEIWSPLKYYTNYFSLSRFDQLLIHRFSWTSMNSNDILVPSRMLRVESNQRMITVSFSVRSNFFGALKELDYRVNITTSVSFSKGC